MKVLIADDSAIIRERLQEMLSNYLTIELVGICDNGLDALEGLRTLNPDLAIVDLKMPGLNGLEVLAEIRKQNKVLKFILFTSHAAENYKQKAMETGADYFFSKADDFDQLELLIEELENIEYIQ